MTAIMTSQGATEPQIREVRRDAGGVELSLYVPQDLLYFRGHFPDYPVLPGIVQIHWSIAYGRAQFNLGPVPVTAMQVKFKKIIVPGASIRLQLAYTPERRRLSFECRSDTAAHSSGTITFGG